MLKLHTHNRLQVSQLSALASLQLVGSSYTPAGMAALTALTSLRDLRLRYNRNLPACLSTLTWLEQLTAQYPVDDDPAFNAVLSSLQNLTCLSLCYPSCYCLPPALAGLSRLQRLGLEGWPEGAEDEPGLPEGPWLASIRWLGLPWELLQPAAAARLLHSAPRLEYLCMYVLDDPPDLPDLPEGHPLWTLAATHPPLRCLGFESSGGVSPFSAEATAALRLRRPQLRLRHLELLPEDGETLDAEEELLESEALPLDGSPP